jgi:diaminohydroxyphosphoribosylaminopyrimidine deaminase/5-amino-6-(5-phosphoribosylamino)uracil reductase
MSHERFMSRCFDLALLGAGKVSPNPMVGAVLVHENRIIGEGWHEQYGQAHAEVNCLKSVAPENQHLIPSSTLYCSLEPCFHHGKTPPCVELILENRIRKVVIANVDPNPKVGGQSVRKMVAAGIEVTTGVLEKEGRWLNRGFFHWISTRQPYVVLKWAQSKDGYLGKPGEQTAISGPLAQVLVHRWRSELDAILVGNTTALIDNPRLDTRFYPGKKPLRIVLDREEKIPASHHLLDDSVETWIYGKYQQTKGQTTWKGDGNAVQPSVILNDLFEANKASLLVEGGANVLEQFIQTGCWNEIRVIESQNVLGNGIPAPGIPAGSSLYEAFKTGNDFTCLWIK